LQVFKPEVNVDPRSSLD